MTTKTEEFANRVVARSMFPGDGSLLKSLITALIEAFGSCQQPPSAVRESIRSPGRLGEARMNVFVRRRLPFRQRRYAGEIIAAMKEEATRLDDQTVETIVLECQSDDVWE